MRTSSHIQEGTRSARYLLGIYRKSSGTASDMATIKRGPDMTTIKHGSDMATIKHGN